MRDEHLLAQPRLTLPAISADTAGSGAWAVRAGVLWSNSFSFDQDVPGEHPKIRRYLIDGEDLTLDVTARRGLTRNLEVGVRLPLRWRGGGILDELIDAWHRAFGLPNGDRPDFIRNAFRVEGLTTDHRPFSWTGNTGAGLGDLELQTKWRVLNGEDVRSSLALVGRLSLPTGSSPFDGNGPGAGGQLVWARPLGRHFDLYTGVGGTVQARGPVRGIEYEPARVHGFFAAEWRPWRKLSLIVETNAASRLIANIDSYPGVHWLLNVSGRLDTGRKTRLDLGFTENIMNQDSTTDFALFLALTVRP